MKKTILGAAMAAMLLTSCGALQGTSNGSRALAGAGSTLLQGALGGGSTNAGSTAAQVGTSVLGSLLGNLLGASATLNDQAIVGTWNYTGSSVVFESENFLAQLGGEVAANTLKGQIDTNLQKIGVKPGACSFTFKVDHTYTATLAGKHISGQWALDPANKQLQLTLLMGLTQLTPKISYNGATLSILMESSKLLSMAQGLGAMTNNSTAKTLSSLLGNYNGMYVGLQLQR